MAYTRRQTPELNESQKSKLVRALGNTDRAIVLAYMSEVKIVSDYSVIATATGLHIDEVKEIMDKERNKGIIVNRNGLILNPQHPLILRIRELKSEILEQSTTPKQREYWERFENYGFEIRKEERVDYKTGQVRPFNPREDDTEVILTLKNGERYIASIVTLEFLANTFEVNKTTGECASGTYFGMPDNMVILKEITEYNVRRTIDDLVKECGVEYCFTKCEETS